MSYCRLKSPAQSGSCWGCRLASVLARGPSWPPVTRLCLRLPRPPGGGGVGSHCRSEFGQSGTGYGTSGGRKKRVV